MVEAAGRAARAFAGKGRADGLEAASAAGCTTHISNSKKGLELRVASAPFAPLRSDVLPSDAAVGWSRYRPGEPPRARVPEAPTCAVRRNDWQVMRSRRLMRLPEDCQKVAAASKTATLSRPPLFSK